MSPYPWIHKYPSLCNVYVIFLPKLPVSTIPYFEVKVFNVVFVVVAVLRGTWAVVVTFEPSLEFAFAEPYFTFPSLSTETETAISIDFDALFMDMLPDFNFLPSSSTLYE